MLLRPWLPPTGRTCSCYFPKTTSIDPELTILIPAMNEELTVGDFVAWCHKGIREAGVVGGDPHR